LCRLCDKMKSETKNYIKEITEALDSGDCLPAAELFLDFCIGSNGNGYREDIRRLNGYLCRALIARYLQKEVERDLSVPKLPQFLLRE